MISDQLKPKKRSWSFKRTNFCYCFLAFELLYFSCGLKQWFVLWRFGSKTIKMYHVFSYESSSIECHNKMMTTSRLNQYKIINEALSSPTSYIIQDNGTAVWIQCILHTLCQIDVEHVNESSFEQRTRATDRSDVSTNMSKILFNEMNLLCISVWTKFQCNYWVFIWVKSCCVCIWCIETFFPMFIRHFLSFNWIFQWKCTISPFSELDEKFVRSDTSILLSTCVCIGIETTFALLTSTVVVHKNRVRKYQKC